MSKSRSTTKKEKVTEAIFKQKHKIKSGAEKQVFKGWLFSSSSYQIEVILHLTTWNYSPACNKDRLSAPMCVRECAVKGGYWISKISADRRKKKGVAAAWCGLAANEARSSSGLLSVCWFECVCLFWFSRMQSLYLFVNSLSNIYELISQICEGLWEKGGGVSSGSQQT